MSILDCGNEICYVLLLQSSRNQITITASLSAQIINFCRELSAPLTALPLATGDLDYPICRYRGFPLRPLLNAALSHKLLPSPTGLPDGLAHCYRFLPGFDFPISIRLIMIALLFDDRLARRSHISQILPLERAVRSFLSRKSWQSL